MSSSSNASWGDEEARRRGVYRELNDQIAQLERAFRPVLAPLVRVTFRCECGDRACLRHVPMLLADYARVRADPRCSVVAPNHENPEVEVVICNDGFHTVVESLAGNASRIAVETDPGRRASLQEAKRVRSRSLSLVPKVGL